MPAIGILPPCDARNAAGAGGIGRLCDEAGADTSRRAVLSNGF